MTTTPTASAVPLILASASPQRRALLKKLKRPFRVMPSHVSESSSEKNPARLVRELAQRKARAIAKKMKTPAIVIGADTLVVLRGTILGKPRDRRHAYQMLYKLSGSTHQVYTGVAVVDAATQAEKSGWAVSHVRMKKIEIDEILRLSRQHLDKAGSYAIQEKRDPIARVVKGSYDNVVGLPVALVRTLLNKLPRKPSRAG